MFSTGAEELVGTDRSQGTGKVTEFLLGSLSDWNCYTKLQSWTTHTFSFC